MKLNVAKLNEFAGHKAAVYTLADEPQADLFYSGDAEGVVACWHLENATEGRMIARVGRPVYSILVNTPGAEIFCGTADGEIYILPTGHDQGNTDRAPKKVRAHTQGVFDMVQSSKHIITAGGDGLVKLWDSENFAPIRTINGPGKSARVISAMPGSSLFAVGYSDWKIRIFSTEHEDMLHEWEAHSNSVFALAFDAAGTRLISGGRDAMLRTWDVQNGYELLNELPAHTMQIKCIAFSPDQQLIATSSMDKTIKIWQAETMELLKVIDKERLAGHRHSVNKLSWIKHDVLTSCGDDRLVMAWEISAASN